MIEDDLVQDYLAECREHLATIEADLLLIEAEGANSSEDLLNRVFRAAHSIKGGAGFFDLVKIRELAHKVENVLDMLRSHKMAPTPEVVSVLLMAFDKLRELIADYKNSNHADVTEFIDAVRRLTTDNLPADQKGSIDARVSLSVPEAPAGIQVSAFDLNQARLGGKHIYLIEYDMIHDVQRQGRSPLALFRELMKFGSILETHVDIDSAGTLDDEPSNQLILEVLYATVLETDLIGDLVRVPPENIRLVERNGKVTPLSDKSSVLSEPAPAVATSIIEAPPTPVASEPVQASPSRKLSVSPSEVATIRLNVSLLDSLMTLAGELVLSRNQLNEAVARKNERDIRSGAQRISLVTSELQEVVTQTRMQPLGVLFSKFPRLVRDLARDLGKDVNFRSEGGDVEIDKGILEGLSDPLTHMVRNAVDHGIESPAQRKGQGKPATGVVTLAASHQAGQVVIEISDDGKGLVPDKVAASAIAKGIVSRQQVETMADRDKMALIFLPGVSTAEKVSDVSGRGVGMDVVKTNLDKLGGKIEIDSAPGKGTRFRIKLPLTLAIIPSLLVSNGDERFAIPQVNVSELIRIPAGQLAGRTTRIGDAELLLLRDRFIPLVHLATALNLSASSATAAMNVVLVTTGAFEYGLVVDALHDTVEIAIKPLGRHLKTLQEYAGATILGDGRVAVILDVAGIAARTGLTAGTVEALAKQTGKDTSSTSDDVHTLLLFQNSVTETCAVAIEQVSRVEHIRPEQIENLGGRRTMHYRGASLPLVALQDTAAVGSLSEEQKWVVIIFERMGRSFGLLAAEPLDMVEAALNIDTVTLRQRGVAGSAVFKDRTLLIMDTFELAETALPGIAEAEANRVTAIAGPSHETTILLAEDSDFFRGQIQRLIEAVGYRVLPAEDGQAAWEILDRHASDVDIVATDIEMPNLDGLGLTRKIRADGRFPDLPVIALTSLAGEDDIARGLAAGVTEYQVKLNKDDLLHSIRRSLGTKER